MTVAFDSVWVSNYVDSTITRIDPATGDVVAEIDTEFGPQIMVEAAGALWVSSVDSDAVQRSIPPATSPTRRSPPSRYRTASWHTMAPSGSRPTSGPILQRLDPATGEITGTWVVSDQGAINANQLVVEAGGAFWFPLLDGGEVLKVTIPS